MIGIVIVAHGGLARELLATLEHVVGHQEQARAIGIGPEEDTESCRQIILDAVAEVDTGEGVAILTDMFGGTPSNLAISVLARERVEVLAGVNVPMLVKLARVRMEAGLDQAVADAEQAGKKYIRIASRLLAER